MRYLGRPRFDLYNEAQIYLRALLLISYLLIGNFAFAQKSFNCSESPLSVVGSMNFQFSKSLIQTYKLGIWQTNKNNGFTATMGYSFGIPETNGFKDSTTSYTSSFIFDFGYKIRILKPVYIHAFLGKNSIRTYPGLGLYFLVKDDILLGIIKENKLVGVNVAFSFKK